jgi:hypothetical protein
MSIRSLLTLVAAVALVGCGDYTAPDSVVNGVAVYTQPNVADAKFASAGTYWVDQAVRIRKDGQDQADQPISSLVGVEAAIDARMTAAHYTKATTQTGAELALKLAISTNTVNYYYSGGWCDIYYGWYGCYYPPVYAGSYKYGTSILAMVDLRAPPSDPTFPGMWSGVMYGVVSSLNATNQQKLVQAIGRAFDQSPYITSAP